MLKQRCLMTSRRHSNFFLDAETMAARQSKVANNIDHRHTWPQLFIPVANVTFKTQLTKSVETQDYYAACQWRWDPCWWVSANVLLSVICSINPCSKIWKQHQNSSALQAYFHIPQPSRKQTSDSKGAKWSIHPNNSSATRGVNLNVLLDI